MTTAHVPKIGPEACMAMLVQLIRIKSYSQTDGELEITRLLAEKMQDLGLDAHVYSFDHGEGRNVIGCWKGSSPSESKSLLFNGHLDTNPVTEGWTVDPWEGKVDDNIFYGIGVSNMKSECAAYLCAIEALKKGRLAAARRRDLDVRSGRAARRRWDSGRYRARQDEGKLLCQLRGTNTTPTRQAASLLIH